uniref:Uncharacterized protein n=1 Tax=Ditylenchus dipsaci TaxID=166011 RepID=A0A915EHA5_9BILA
MGMNPLAVQLPENIDPNEIVVELAQRKAFLLDKFKHELSTLEKVFPPPKEILESRELKSLLQIESKIKKIRETSNFPKALMENYTICELIQSSHNELAYADKHVSQRFKEYNQFMNCVLRKKTNFSAYVEEILIA